MARQPDVPLDETDLAVLGPLAEHRILTVPQVALLLGVGERTAARRLNRLARARLVRMQRIFTGTPAAAAISSAGLRALGSPLRAPQLNLNEYRHDVGVAWLWLAARAGGLGETATVNAERSMRAQDAAAVARGEAVNWGIGLGLLGRHGRPERHYPDLMLVTAAGQRIAIELELTGKSARRMTRIMTAYASEARVEHVLYLAADRGIAGRVSEAARRAGIGPRVHVQLLAPGGIAGAPAARLRAAAPGHGRGPATPAASPARGR